METTEKAIPDDSSQKNIYSRIEPDLSTFTVEQLEKALTELDNL